MLCCLNCFLNRLFVLLLVTVVRELLLTPCHGETVGAIVPCENASCFWSRYRICLEADYTVGSATRWIFFSRHAGTANRPCATRRIYSSGSARRCRATLPQLTSCNLFFYDLKPSQMSLYPTFRPLFFYHRPLLPARSVHVPALSCSGSSPLSTPLPCIERCRRPVRAREQRNLGFATLPRVPLQKCGSSERSHHQYQKFSGLQLPPPRDGLTTRDFWS